MVQESRTAFAEIPERYKFCKLENFNIDIYKQGENVNQAAKMLKVARTFVANLDKAIESGTGLYFWSRTKGSGKSRIMASIGNELVYKGYLVRFITSASVVNAIKASWTNGGDSKIINDLVTADILLLDDFGAEVIRDWISEKFYTIINERYSNNRITLFTSNLPIEELEYDERIINRLYESALPVKAPEESVRKEIHDARKAAI